jgi:hypothetical protein
MSQVPDYILQVEALKAIWGDIAYLHQAGAVDGVAEVIRERRRQIEQLNYTPEHDDGFTATADLASMASLLLARVKVGRQQGTADIGSDEEGPREAGALLAAEIDRLNRLARS